MNPFKSIHQLWLEKIRQLEPEPTQSEYAHFGTILEPIVKKEFMERTGLNVQIYDEKKQQWISKMDVGTESYTEKEKGQASDSFKRACVSVGIGRELYTAPFIWVSSSKCNIQKKDNKFVTYDKFKVKEIAYNDNREIIELTILNQDGMIVYSLKSEVATVPKADLTKETKTTVLMKQQIKELNKELDRTGVILDTVLQRYGIQNTTQMTPEIFKSAMQLPLFYLIGKFYFYLIGKFYFYLIGKFYFYLIGKFYFYLIGKFYF